MYKLLLILKYLRRRRIAWVSLAAVTLCTTMVIVVISIMGGWLRMYETNARGMTSDIVIRAGGLSGFAYYQEIIDRVEARADVEAAVPQIESKGLVTLGIKDDGPKRTDGVQVFGIKAGQMGRVNAWPKSLYRQHTKYLDENKTPPAIKTFDVERTNSVQLRGPPRWGSPNPQWGRLLLWAHVNSDYLGGVAALLPPEPVWSKLKYTADGRLVLTGKLTDVERDTLIEAAPRDMRWRQAILQLAREASYPGLIAGARFIDITKDRSGALVGRDPFKYEVLWAKLTVLGIGANEQIEEKNRTERTYWVIDDSRTGMWQYDNNTVYVDFDRLQVDLGMEAKEGEDVKTGKKVIIPARTSLINIKLKPNADVEAARTQIEQIVDDVILSHGLGVRDGRLPRVETWRKASQTYLDAIEKEKVLVVFLFAIVSVVAIFLIFCIFYMIVAEKTKDIGIIKSVGATNLGVAAIFLGYGLFIGIIGAALGLLLSYLTIHNINEIHTWLGSTFRLVVWNPEVYAFDTIPSTMDTPTVAVICVTAVFASVVGALVPAVRAARMHPVEALRWE